MLNVYCCLDAVEHDVFVWVPLTYARQQELDRNFLLLGLWPGFDAEKPSVIHQSTGCPCMDPTPSLVPRTHLTLRSGCLLDNDMTVYMARPLLAA